MVINQTERRFWELSKPLAKMTCPIHMKKIAYQLWDVFTSQSLAGNQLAVVMNGDDLEDNEMQKIANEFSLPETSFVTTSKLNECDYKIRIFTPARELPMAGHPTIGTTFALEKSGLIPQHKSSSSLELGVGPTSLSLRWTENKLGRVWMSQRWPIYEKEIDNEEAMAEILGISSSALSLKETPAQISSSGVRFLLVPLKSNKLVDSVNFNRARFQEWCSMSGLEECPVYVFCFTPSNPPQTYSRMFAPVLGIPEDPATGGACGPLAGYLQMHYPEALSNGDVINRQGVSMGRPSTIHISIKNSTPLNSVKIGGEAQFIGEGYILV